MTDTSFKVGSHAYRVGHLKVLEQNHVARKFGSVLIFLTSLKAEPGKEIGPEDYARVMVATSGNLPDESVDYVMGACFSVVSRQQAGGAWAPMRAPTGQLMFDDLELKELMEIVYHVLQAHKLIDFFAAPPSGSPPPPAGGEQR